MCEYYVLQCKVNVNGTIINLGMNVNADEGTDTEARLAARGFKKFLDSYVITEQLDGYELSMYRALLTPETVIPSKTLYHKSKGDSGDEDSGE